MYVANISIAHLAPIALIVLLTLIALEVLTWANVTRLCAFTLFKTIASFNKHTCIPHAYIHTNTSAGSDESIDRPG